MPAGSVLAHRVNQVLCVHGISGCQNLLSQYLLFGMLADMNNLMYVGHNG